MKAKCNIIKDLIPLYIENIASDESCNLIEEHIKECSKCNQELIEMKFDTTSSIETSTAPLEKIRKQLQKKRIKTASVSALITAIMVVLSVAYFTAPEFLSYSSEPIEINEVNDSIVISFDDAVTDYKVNEKSQNIFEITTWNTIFGNLTHRESIAEIVLNPNGEKVNTVYYISNNGTEDKVIYGENPVDNGGRVTLPRVFLNYYATLAAFVILICAIISFVFRKNIKISKRIHHTILFPLSYLVSQFVIRGFSGSTYSATRDLYAISLLTIPLFFVLIFLYNHLYIKHTTM